MSNRNEFDPGSDNLQSHDGLPAPAREDHARFGDLDFTPYHAQVAALSIAINHPDERSLAPTLFSSRVDIRPHQVESAIFALQSPLSAGVILADETGLGKTIEAGIAIAQRWAERSRSILLIVPASLRSQWRHELHWKFALPSRVVDGPAVDAIIETGGSLVGADPKIVIMSYGVASSKSEILTLTAWDLVVIDEAHRLRNVATAGPRSHARRIRDALRGRKTLLLTATPLQNSLAELHGLLSIIDDRMLCSPADFALLYAKKPDAARLTELGKSLKSVLMRHLRTNVQAAGHVAYTNRIARTFRFTPYDDEIELYDFVSSYLQREETVAFGSPPNPLILTVARKILASSTAATAGFLRTVLGRLGHAQSLDLASLDDVEDFSGISHDAQDLAEARAREGVGVPEGSLPQTGVVPGSYPGLDEEVAEVARYLALAEGITANAKGDRLVASLKDLLDEIARRGGQRKAVIFTESRKTQSYLVRLLQSSGYDEQIITLNGSNDDRESARLLHEWRARHRDDDEISGLRSADAKAAIIEAFLHADTAILVSTESGGEGVNLQACSLVINYDLPWNPQRLEQRIGRCHRYGQKLDVVVLNLSNTENKIEQRLLDLLTRKFKIFEGVFGVSDDVLGAIEADVDLGREVLSILQTCRTNAEIEAAFAALERRLEAAITSDLHEARRQLFAHLDEDVIQRLKACDSHTATLLDDYNRRLGIMIRAELPEAIFDDGAPLTFATEGTTWTTRWSDAKERGARFFALGQGRWGSEIVDRAASRPLPDGGVRFDIGAMRAAGFPRLSDVERYSGRAGWVRVCRITFDTPLKNPREALLVVGVTDDGEVLHPETALRFFNVPGVSFHPGGLDAPSLRMTQLEDEEQARLTEACNSQNLAWLILENDKLDARVEAVLRSSELKVSELRSKAASMRVRLRGHSRTSADFVAEHREIRRIEMEADQIHFDSFHHRNNLRNEVERNLDAMEVSLRVTPYRKLLFEIRWEII